MSSSSSVPAMEERKETEAFSNSTDNPAACRNPQIPPKKSPLSVHYFSKGKEKPNALGSWFLFSEGDFRNVAALSQQLRHCGEMRMV